MDEGEATSRGRERDQISIWDVANFKEVQTGGTGGIEKTRGSRTTRYVKHDRRADRRIRQRDLGETRTRQTRFEVIYFDFGLKPVFKHGEHDQSEHGNWARGFTDSERELIERMDGVGPSLEDLDNVIKENREVSDDEIRMLVDNDRYMYGDIQSIVEDRLASRQDEISQMSESEQIRVQEQMTDMVTQEYIEDNRDNLAERVLIESGELGGGGQDASELQPYFDEVFSVEHTGTSTSGNEVTLRSTVEEVYRDGDDIMVSAGVYDEDNNRVGEVGAGNTIRNGEIGSLYGIPVFVSSNADTATGGARIALMGHKDAAVLVEQQGVRSQTQYKQEYLGTLYTADTLYGVKELRDTACFALAVPA